MNHDKNVSPKEDNTPKLTTDNKEKLNSNTSTEKNSYNDDKNAPKTAKKRTAFEEQFYF